LVPLAQQEDPTDADLLLEILTAHRSRLRRLDPDTGEMRLLQSLVENRRKLVDERTALSNRLTDLLKLYFPQILGCFNDVASAVVGDLLERWPSLQDLQQVRPAKLEKFLRDHHCSEISERLTQIRQALPATPAGLKAIAALVVLREKAIRPGLAAAQQLRRSRGPQNPTARDRPYEIVRIGIAGIFRELGVAA
jgi:hypothetical protein